MTVDSLDDGNPQVHGSLIGWHAWDGTDFEVCLHDVSTGQTGQLTNDSFDEMFP